jgi:hypothetical protein
MSETKVDPHVSEMRRQLAEVRRVARGVKDSARGLRLLPKSERMQAATSPRMDDYDLQNPPMPHPDDTTRRIG